MDRGSVWIFDAYGTLLDVTASARRVLADQPGEARLLAEIWRGRQLEYAWTDTALGHPTNFWNATERALDVALSLTGLDGDPARRAALLKAYAELDAYPDAKPVLQRVAHAGGRAYIYSNANPDMLRKSVVAAGLDSDLEDMISVDGGGVYKPNAAAYAHIVSVLDIDPAVSYFISSNPWDAAGAASSGFRGIWVNRLGHPYPFPRVSLYREVRSLDDLK